MIQWPECAISGDSMSARLRSVSICALLFVFAVSANLAFAQSQWKEIPVGYNMPKAVMAAAPASAMAAPFPQAAKKSTYGGAGRNPKPSWEIEFHGGGFFTTSQDQGTPGVFDPGTPFTTVSGDPSLQVSSYMFGPGATLTQQFGATLLSPLAGVTSLDPIAHSQMGSRQSGPSVGARISRDLNSRFNLEFSVDWNASPVSIGDKALLGVEATRSSFATFFAGASPNTLVALSDVKRSQGSQLFWTGVVNVNLKTEGKNIPYLTFGAGGVSALGPAPHAAILGYYDFDVPGGAGTCVVGPCPHAETDLVNLHSSDSRTSWVAVLGIGYKYYATQHWGIRFDVRDHLTPNNLDTLIDATPHVAILSPSDVIEGSPGSSPDLQFSNNTNPLTPSSLSGPAIVGRHTFRGDGWVNQVSASGGVFYRF
jgi:hypothetical protein